MTDWNDLLGPYRKERRAGQLLADAAAEHLGPGALAEVPKMAFLVIRPDAVATGQAGALLERIRQEFGALPTAIQVVRMSEAEFNSLYEHELYKMGRKVWLYHHLFTLGPAVVILVKSTSLNPHKDLGDLINQAKGEANILLSSPVDLRTAIGRMSTLHVGFHSSDNGPAAIRESSLFFTWDSLRSALLGDELPANIWRSALPLPVDPARSVFMTILGVKKRIFASAWMHDPTHRRHFEELIGLACSFEEISASLTYVQQRKEFRRFAAAEFALLSSTPPRNDLDSPSPAHSRAMELSAWLSGHCAATDIDPLRRLNELDTIGVALDAWSTSKLLSALEYDTNPAARWNGQPLFENPWVNP